MISIFSDITYGATLLHTIHGRAQTVRIFICGSYCHYSEAIIGAMVFQITGVSIVCSTVCSSAGKIKYQISASLAFVRGNHRWPVDSPHKDPVKRKIFLSDDIMVEAYGVYEWLHGIAWDRAHILFPTTTERQLGSHTRFSETCHV